VPALGGERWPSSKPSVALAGRGACAARVPAALPRGRGGVRRAGAPDAWQRTRFEIQTARHSWTHLTQPRRHAPRRRRWHTAAPSLSSCSLGASLPEPPALCRRSSRRRALLSASLSGAALSRRCCPHRRLLPSTARWCPASPGRRAWLLLATAPRPAAPLALQPAPPAAAARLRRRYSASTHITLAGSLRCGPSV
jgi:hypothetical protein